MSAKGLPPAVRLDPLPLLPTCRIGNIQFDASQARKINGLLSPSHNSPQPQTQTLARGLTPIIITPESSSRPHTPAAGGSDRGTPGLSSMRTLTMTGTTGKQTKKMKFEYKLEPVELDPILPGGKVEKAKAVSMVEDEGTKLPQLPPTPCMTPVLHPVELIEGERGLGGEEGEFGDKSPRTGRIILPAFRSRPDDPASAHRQGRNLSLSDLADVAERERLVYDDEDGKRGRTKERRKNSRFRGEKVRYKPYDPGMGSLNCKIQSRSGCIPSSRLPTPTHTMPPSRPASHFTGTDSHPTPTPHQPPSLPPPPHPPSLSPALPPITPPNPIPKAADHLIHLFNSELQNQIQAERESLRSEYENLMRERSEIQQERELMRRERDEHRSYGTFVGTTNEGRDREIRDLREENQMLRNRVEELDNMLREAGRPTPGDAMKPSTPL